MIVQLRVSAEDVINFNEAEKRNWWAGGAEGEQFCGVNLEGAVVEYPNLTDLASEFRKNTVYINYSFIHLAVGVPWTQAKSWTVGCQEISMLQQIKN